jgi:predicted TIM-barrel enzyme
LHPARRRKPGICLRSVHATITKVVDGYTVTLVMKENGETRQLVDNDATSYAEAESAARAFAATHDVPWEKVQVVSR